MGTPEVLAQSLLGHTKAPATTPGHHLGGLVERPMIAADPCERGMLVTPLVAVEARVELDDLAVAAGCDEQVVELESEGHCIRGASGAPSLARVGGVKHRSLSVGYVQSATTWNLSTDPHALASLLLSGFALGEPRPAGTQRQTQARAVRLDRSRDTTVILEVL